MNRDIKRILIEKLSLVPMYNASDDGTEHNVRCPYCGDSQKDPTHTHLGIHIDPDDDDAMPWNCLRCGAHGRVTDEFLYDIGVVINEQELSDLKLYTRNVDKISKRTILRTENFVVPMPQPTRANYGKLAYFNDRIGAEYRLEDLPTMKVVPSLAEFMVANGIKTIPGIAPSILAELERKFIGFLSANNNLLTFRHCIGEQASWRYYKLFLNPANEDSATFYSVPTKLSLFYDGPLNIHISEGTFDIVSVRCNLMPQPGHNIYYAACGYSYLSILKHIARAGIIGHIHLHIYADKDKSDRQHMKILDNPILKLTEHCTIHRNRFYGEKDYGVPGANIRDSSRQLW